MPTVKHDFAHPLPDLGDFDLVVSCMAIHHMPDERKRAIYAEVFAMLEPGGLFLHLEHVAPGSERLHAEFYAALGVPPDDDPSDQTAPVDDQLRVAARDRLLRRRLHVEVARARAHAG